MKAQQTSLPGFLILLTCLICFPLTSTAATISYTGWGSASQIESIDAEIAAFQAKHGSLGIDIDSHFVPWDGYHEKLIVQAAAGALPDVMLISGAFFSNIEIYNVFLDLRPYFERDKLRYDYLPPGTDDFLTINGKLAGMPADGFRPRDAMVNLNLDFLSSAGLDQPSWDWTWEDLLQYAQRLTRDADGDGQNDQFGVDFGKTTWEGVWEYMLYGYGGSLWNDDYSACAINSPAAEYVFTFLRDLDSRWQVHGWTFPEGRVGISIAWANEAARRLDVVPFSAGLAPLPRGSVARSHRPASGEVHVYAISKATPHPEEAWRFVKFLFTEPEAVLARNLNSVAGPAYKPLMDPFARRLPDKQQDWLKISLLQLAETPAARPLGDSVLISYDDRQQIITTWLDRFYADQIPVTEALASIENQINVRLKEIRQRAKEAKR